MFRLFKIEPIKRNGRCTMKIREKNKVSPEKALEMLRKDGLEVSLEEAKLVLGFLKKLAKIVVSQYLSNGNS